MITYTVNIDYGDKVQEGMDIPKALKELRHRAGWTLHKLNKKSGVSYNHVSNIERGQSMPGMDTLNKLLQALGADTVEVKYGVYTEPGRVMVNVYV